MKNTIKLKLSILTLLGTLAVSGAETVPVDTLDLSLMTVGWGKAMARQSITGKPLSIAGKKYEQGVGAHAYGYLNIDLNGQGDKFQAAVGVDDVADKDKSSVIFKVVGDGKVLWSSGIMKAGQPAKPIDISVRGVKTLTLVAGDAGDGNSYDHADWADARLVMISGTPKAIRAPHEEAVILTPKTPAKPRINGPRVFGARPESPFLYSIPVSGERPMTYSVDGLPPGLKVDAATGQIKGITPPRGDYSVTLRASNAKGTAERSFKILSGDTLALTPHMGWNSWYVWENHVTDKIMRDAAQAMATNGMKDHGYMYVNIDDCWSIKPSSEDPTLKGKPRDDQNRINSNGRFPDMKALTDYIHSLGLKAGTYTSPGPETCAGHVGAYKFEAVDAKRYADWGFDFLKYDWCSYGGIAPNNSLPELQKPYQLMGDILKKQNRDIILNLCQYGMGEVWKWGREVGGHSWRTAGDLGLSFEGIAPSIFRDGFDVYSQNELHKYGGPGGWNDPDYLLLGYLSNWKGQTAPTPLTPNEQYTHISLWAMVAAPLIFSGDITRADEFTLNLLCNDEIIDVDQDTLGKPGKRLSKNEEQEIWTRDMEDSAKVVGLFNRGEYPVKMTVKWSDLGIKGRYMVRDIWRQTDLGREKSSYSAVVPRHGVVMLRLSPTGQ
jgi:alpha-galactosidase